MTYETIIDVRYAETDQMGIVHHSNYPIWFEVGRTDFLKGMGYSYSKIEDEGILLPLIELKCCFKKPAMYGNEVLIKVNLINISKVKITFSYELYNLKDNSLLATGETIHAWTDKNLKPVSIKKKMPSLHQALIEKSSLK